MYNFNDNYFHWFGKQNKNEDVKCECGLEKTPSLKREEKPYFHYSWCPKYISVGFY